MGNSSLAKAIEIATIAHQGQKRSSGEDYITHPLAVMEILKEENLPEEVLIGAVLHDTVEDTPLNQMEINKKFPDRIGFIVYALSKNLKPSHNEKWEKKFKEAKEKKEANTETFDKYYDYRFNIYLRRFYLGCIADPSVLFIKIADQIHNLSTMESLTPEKKARKVKEVEDHFFPLYTKLESTLSSSCEVAYRSLRNKLEKVIENL